jgi:hypothetical protein
MKEILISVEVTFFDIAKESFNFPISRSVRMSFWLPESNISTFSEIHILEEEIEIGKLCKAQIRLVERDFLRGKMNIGQEFRLGVYPTEIAYGRIMQLETL